VNWEFRFPLISCRARDESKLSPDMRERIAHAAATTPAQYNAALKERERVRALYAGLASLCDGCISLTATGAAPVGLASTGSPVFAVPFSFLGVPALSLPLLREQNLPLGFQVTGFANRDAEAFAVAGFVTQALRAAA